MFKIDIFAKLSIFLYTIQTTFSVKGSQNVTNMTLCMLSPWKTFEFCNVLGVISRICLLKYV